VADHINLDIIDTYALIDQVTGDPAAYGFTNVTDPVWSGTGQGVDTGTLAATTQAAQDQYFFWDSLHPTETGQALIAGAAENLTFG
jgi:outer membrane lipase/esterase